MPRNSRWTGFSMPTPLHASARRRRRARRRTRLRGGPRRARARRRRMRRAITSGGLRSLAAVESAAGRTYPPPPEPEAFWPAQVTVLAAIGLQLALPTRLTVGPSWLIPALEGLLLVGMFFATPNQLEHEHTRRRRGRARPDGVRERRERLLARRTDPLPAAPQRLQRTATDHLGRADLADELPDLRAVVLGDRPRRPRAARGRARRRAGLPVPADERRPHRAARLATASSSTTSTSR